MWTPSVGVEAKSCLECELFICPWSGGCLSAAEPATKRNDERESEAGLGKR